MDNLTLYVKLFEKNKILQRYMFSGIPGTGKAQPLSSKILTPNGWVTMGKIRIGDIVLTPKGKKSNVTEVFPQGKLKIYEIKFKDGRKTKCCENHLWKVYGLTNSKTSEIIKTINLIDKLKNTRIPLTIDLIDSFNHNFIKLNDYTNIYSYFKSSDFYEKYIHGNSSETLSIIEGLIETGGYLDKHGNLKYATDSTILAEYVQKLIWSIGGLAKIKKLKNKCIISITLINQKNITNSLDRAIEFKKLNNISEIKNEITSIKYVGVEEAKCIMIDDSEHLYITDDYIVTHNTESTRAISNILNKKGVTIIKTNICEEIKNKIDLAKILAPSLIILDDIDLYLGDRNHGMISPILGLFLDVLDGVDKLPSNVGIIATTNAPHLIDLAAQRPGRFNKLLFFDDLTKDNIKSVILKSLNSMNDEFNNITKNDIKTLTDDKLINFFKDDGSTGAFIYETIKNLKFKTEIMGSELNISTIIDEIKLDNKNLSNKLKISEIKNNLDINGNKIGY